jgi:2-polyprenyl-3-methyl-5-hydroxy-6-metoxy-1,4-benzoquinol methylase
MTTKQQQEALEFFDNFAENWRSRAENLDGKIPNTINQRNNYVLKVADKQPKMHSFLDVGSGTGELVCNMAKRGVDSQGIDFAQEMIDLSTKKATNEGITRAKFTHTSIFDFDFGSKNFDLISANGFIEYISQKEMTVFFDLVADALRPGGSFVFGSRNRLFNLASMNSFTLQEIESGSLEALTREAVMWTLAKDITDVQSIDCVDFQAPETKHAETGIDVVTRFQYSPLQLINLLNERNLQTIEVYPVHIHGATPTFCSSHPEIHVPFSNLLQTHADQNTQLLTNASTFMMHVKKMKTR